MNKILKKKRKACFIIQYFLSRFLEEKKRILHGTQGLILFVIDKTQNKN